MKKQSSGEGGSGSFLILQSILYSHWRWSPAPTALEAVPDDAKEAKMEKQNWNRHLFNQTNEAYQTWIAENETSLTADNAPVALAG